MLKDVKEDVIKNNFDRQIQSVRKTREGGLIITLDKESKEQIKDALTMNMSKTKIKVKKKETNDVTLHIKDIDGITKEKEIEAAIKKELEEEEPCLTIKSVRPSYAETQTATIVTDEKTASKLLLKDRIRIGILNC